VKNGEKEERKTVPMLPFLRHYGTLTGLAFMVLAFCILLPDTFLAPRNLMNIAQQMSILAVIAMTMTIVMAMGDFDLSVGSMASLAGIVAAMVFQATGSVPLGVSAALLTGVIGGTLNGVLVSYVGILPFVATLGTLTIFSGTAFLISGGKTIFGAAIPASFSGIAKGGIPLWQSGDQILQLPNLVILGVLILFAVWFAMHKLVFGRHIRAIGGNVEAAHLAGINVKAVRLAAFALVGLGAAMAGLMLTSRVASANPIQGAGLMLDAIAAVFLGMTMNSKNEPRVLGTLVGVGMLGLLSNGLTQLSINSYVREILVGTIIIAAVALSGAAQRKT
jgi:ribose transport system permease protein